MLKIHVQYVNGFINRLEIANFTIVMHFHFVYYRITQKVVGDLVLSSLLKCMKLLVFYTGKSEKQKTLTKISMCQGEAFEILKRSSL